MKSYSEDLHTHNQGGGGQWMCVTWSLLVSKTPDLVKRWWSLYKDSLHGRKEEWKEWVIKHKIDFQETTFKQFLTIKNYKLQAWSFLSSYYLVSNMKNKTKKKEYCCIFLKLQPLISRYTIHRRDEILVGKGKMDQCQLSVFPLERYLIGPAVTWQMQSDLDSKFGRE